MPALCPRPLFVLLGAGCWGPDTDDGLPCTDTCRTAIFDTTPDDVPYGWCEPISAELARIHGAYTCQATGGVDLGDEVIEMVVAPADGYEDTLQINGGDYGGVCTEIVFYYVDIHFASAALRSTLYGVATIQNDDGDDGDRVGLFAGDYLGPGIDGWLLDGSEGTPIFLIYSKSAVGSGDKRWTVSINPGPGADRYTFTCQ